jgi:hypothetical protein
MRNLLKKVFALSILLSLLSCKDFESSLDTKESFEKNRNKYEIIVKDIEKHRDKLKKTKEDTGFLKNYVDDDLGKLGDEYGRPAIISTDPLVISFVPRTYTYAIWYAETSKSAKFVLSHPFVLAEKYYVRHLEGKWYLITTDYY